MIPAIAPMSNIDCKHCKYLVILSNFNYINVRNTIPLTLGATTPKQIHTRTQNVGTNLSTSLPV